MFFELKHEKNGKWMLVLETTEDHLTSISSYSQSVIVFKNGSELPISHQQKKSSNFKYFWNFFSLTKGQGGELLLQIKLLHF